MNKSIAIDRLYYLQQNIKDMGRFKGSAAIRNEIEQYIVFIETHMEDQEHNKRLIGMGEKLLAQAWQIIEPHKAHEYEAS